jgi:hypothetical protein
MEFVKRYIYPSDYRNLILVNKEFYSIFKYSSPYVQLNNLLYKGGWFSKYTHVVLHQMNFLDTIKCLIDTLEYRSKVYPKHYVNWITRRRIKRRLHYLDLCF